MRRRDPVKRAFWIGGFCLFLMVLWAALLQLKLLAANSTLGRHNRDWRSIEKRYGQITNNQAVTGDMERKLVALQRVATNRFLWGPPLNALQTTTTDNVQLVRLSTLQSSTARTATKSKPAAITDKVSFTLQARDLSPPSEQKLIEALWASPYFKQNLRKGDGIQLKNVGTPQVDPLTRLRTSLFTIECFYPDKERS